MQFTSKLKLHWIMTPKPCKLASLLTKEPIDKVRMETLVAFGRAVKMAEVKPVLKPACILEFMAA